MTKNDKLSQEIFKEKAKLIFYNNLKMFVYGMKFAVI